MEKKTDSFILIIPASNRFLPLVRQAVSTLVVEANIKPKKMFEFQVAVAEACNLVAHAYTTQETEKTISVSAMYDGNQAQVKIDDGAGSRSGQKMRQKIDRRHLPLEGKLALKTAKSLCDNVTLASGITGGLRIELTKTLQESV